MEKKSEASGALSITTKDGDTVTLSYEALSELSMAAVSTRSEYTKSQGLAMRQTNEVSVSMTVNGELDKQEWGEIGRLFKKFARALQDFLGGDSGKAAARMTKVGKLDTVSGMTVELERQESVTAASAQLSAVGSGRSV